MSPAALGIDVGGTFTDVAAWDGRRLTVVKTSTTPDQSDGVERGAAEAAREGALPVLFHGTTVATNALLERAGTDVALVTDAGFEDLIEIGRQSRPSLYDPFADRPPALAPRHLRYGVSRADLDGVAARVAGARPAAVVVALLHGYADPSGEDATVRALVRAGVDPESVVSAGRHLSEFREFERISTAVLTAYLRPVVRRYLGRVGGRVVPRFADRLLVMRSSGGVVTAEEAVRSAAGILLSGPAGGVVAASRLGDALGHRRIISFDMGGTSTDVCRVEDGRPEIAYEREIDGYVCRLPSVAVHTVGAGGGSLGWVDAGGALRVGPRSAGAHPGPAAYGRGGTEPAVTDAHLALGRISATARLAGSLPLSGSRAREALERLGERLGLDLRATALGMVEVVESHMARAIRRVSVEEGADPRDAVLVAFGGAGGLHATALARRLEMAGVTVPPYAGVFSALGLLMSPPRWDVVAPAPPGGVSALDAAVESAGDEAVRALRETIGVDPTRLDTTVDVRYVGQSHETTVPYRPGEGEGERTLAGRFHDLHRERNGFARPDDPIETMTVRASAVGDPALQWVDLPDHEPQGDARRGSRRVDIGGWEAEVAVWWRPGMRPGQEVEGPAVVEESESTIYLAPGDRGRLHPSGALEVEW